MRVREGERETLRYVSAAATTGVLVLIVVTQRYTWYNFHYCLPQYRITMLTAVGMLPVYKMYANTGTPACTLLIIWYFYS